MNAKNNQLKPEFGPETRFEVRPAVAAFRVTQETELERLKGQLLKAALNATPDQDANAPLRRAANEAAALAWTTQFPLLFFPTLLEEKAVQALQRVEKQRDIFVRTQQIFAVTA